MQGEFDYDESVDVFLNVEGATPELAPVSLDTILSEERPR
jgi:hypothetical protein